MSLVVLSGLALVLMGSSNASAVPSSGDDWLRAQTLTPAYLLGFAVSGDSAYPLTDVLPGVGRHADTLRAGTLRAAHSRVFTSFDYSRKVQILLTEYVNATFASPVRAAGSPVELLPPVRAPGAVVTRTRSENATDLHVAFAHGRVRTQILITLYSASAQASADAGLELARSVADQQLRQLSDAPDLTTRTTVSFARERTILWTMLVATILGLQAVFGAYGLVSDRASRELLWSRLKGFPGQPPVNPAVALWDVSVHARRRRWRHRLGAVTRTLTFLVLLVTTFRLPTLIQVGVYAAFAFVVSVGELVLARLRRRLSFRAAYGARALLAHITATVLTISLSGLAAVLLFLPVVAAVVGPMTMDPDVVFGLSVGYFLAGLVVVVLTEGVYRLGRRWALRSTDILLKHDTRAEILLLRSFLDDGLTVRAHRTGRQALVERFTLRRSARFEEILAWVLWRFGPVVAFSEPGLRLPRLGAARIIVGDSDWVAVVDEKIRQAPMTVMVAGRTRAVVLEIERIRLAGALGRTIFIFPPVAAKEITLRLKVVAAALDLERDVLARTYPESRYLLALHFGGDGTPIVSVAGKRDDVSYQVAIEQAADEIRARQSVQVFGPTDVARAVVPHREQQDLPYSPPLAQVRRRRFRAWMGVAPLVMVLVSTLCGKLFLPPDPAPAVALPGDVFRNVQVNSVTPAGAGTVQLLDPTARTLTHLGSDGQLQVMYTFTAVPLSLVVAGSMSYVTTRAPFGVVGLRWEGDRYTAAWTAPLEAFPAGVARIGERVAVLVPGLDQVVALDAATGVRLGVGMPGRGPRSAAAYGSRLLVGNVTDGTVAILDMDTLKPVSVYPMVGPESLLVDGDQVFIASIEDSSLVAMQLPTGQIGQRTPVAQPNGQIAVSVDRIALATYGVRPHLMVFSRRDMHVLATYTLPSTCAALALVDAFLFCALPEQTVLIRIPIG